MARPRKCRRVCGEPEYNRFLPGGEGKREQVFLSVDEFEILRLIDYEKLTQEACAQQMGVARTSITDSYDKARYKVADCLVNGKELCIAGGQYMVCNGREPICGSPCCQMHAAKSCSAERKEVNQMRIAVTYENETVFQHFGHTEQFAFYDTENGEIKRRQIVSTNGQGHGALAQFLKDAGVDVLICGGIGGGAIAALQAADIDLFGGVEGHTDEAVKAYLEGRLAYQPDVHCDHHDHEHGEGHTCGSHGCGEHGESGRDCGEHGENGHGCGAH